MSNEYLTDDLKRRLDEVAELIQKEKEVDVTLYASTRYLEAKVAKQELEAELLPGNGRPVFSLDFFTAEDGNFEIVGHFTGAGAAGATMEGPFDFPSWTPAEKQAFPKQGGGPSDLDPVWMTVSISDGSTRYCYYTSAGKKICYLK